MKLAVYLKYSSGFATACDFIHMESSLLYVYIIKLAAKMLLMEHKKVNMFSHAIMADVKNGNQHLHFSENLKYSENLGMQAYSHFFKELSQLKHSIQYCT